MFFSIFSQKTGKFDKSIRKINEKSKIFTNNLFHLVALAGIACICTCLGFEELFKMKIKRGTDSTEATRKIGLTSGTDIYLNNQKSFVHWPIKCKFWKLILKNNHQIRQRCFDLQRRGSTCIVSNAVFLLAAK